jgi:hypothetical protein
MYVKLEDLEKLSLLICLFYFGCDDDNNSNNTIHALLNGKWVNLHINTDTLTLNSAIGDVISFSPETMRCAIV